MDRSFGRTHAVICLLLACSVVLGTSGWGRAGGKRDVATLGVGDAVFWMGDQIEGAPEEGPLPVPLPSLWGNQPAKGCGDDCFEYGLEVAGKGQMLRVSVDTPDCRDGITMELIDPSGEIRRTEISCYSAEVYVRNPEKGMWIVKATASGFDPVFRMRAKLEGSKRKPTSRRALLPNLRVEPPHDFRFDSDGLGLASDSCYEEEVVEDGARRCLRFAVGPQNTGKGPLELRFSKDADVARGASMTQRIHYSDGSTEMRDAGESEFHKAHGHFHLKGFARFTLFRVTNRETGEVKHAGIGNKAGFCLVDMRIARWRRFDQARSFTARSNCMPVGGKAEVGLSAGWTDIYGAELSGNYIDVGNSPDGLYVLRTEVDSGGYILESNEEDNVGYSFFELDGNRVRLIERGRGSDPWDPDKAVARSWWKS